MPTISNFYPPTGVVGSGVKITGTGLLNVTEVLFNTTRATTVIPMGGTQIRATVPQNATSGKITVVAGDKRASSSRAFIVDEEGVVATRVSYLRAADLNPIETALAAAWNNAFASPSDPNSMQALAKGYDPIDLGNLSGGSIWSGNLDICVVPDDPYSPIAKGDAQLSFNSLSLAGLSSISNGGVPAFHNNDTQAVFTANLGQLTVKGSFNISQTCCIPSLLGCGGDFGGQEGDSLTYKINSAKLVITATVSTNPLAIEVSGLAFNLTGSTSVELGGDNNSWHWLSYLDGYILTENSIKSSLTASIQSVLDGSQMAGQIQTLLNKGIAQ